MNFYKKYPWPFICQKFFSSLQKFEFAPLNISLDHVEMCLREKLIDFFDLYLNTLRMGVKDFGIFVYDQWIQGVSLIMG